MSSVVRCRINGLPVEFEALPGVRLLEILRVRLRLVGAKLACGRGECGACTVLVDGKPIMACTTLARKVDGHEVETIEGLASESKLLREAFADMGAFQCGFCTPGQIVTGTAILRAGIPPREQDIRKMLSGNICRCTGYQSIVKAIQRAAGHSRIGISEETR